MKRLYTPITIIVLIACASFIGCAGMQPINSSPSAPAEAAAEARLNNTAPIIQPPPVERQRHEGSLWEENGPYSGLFTNYTARIVGDIVTVKIVENASAKGVAETGTEKDSSLTAGIDGFFNAEKRFPTSKPFLNPFSKVAGSFKNEFTGKGEIKRSNNLNAYISARVVQVMPGGNLRITGSRYVNLNSEEQIITLSGVIRPEDISANNEIRSTYIADARISYHGVGVLSEHQNPGWLTRTLNVVWPF
ncbi:MAG: flagellar basal body L-ring protein FlgH [Desulfobacterales bacterium]|nr:flagellar basal body L-ring protein FlgH [Desulfobacterales bacterium]